MATDIGGIMEALQAQAGLMSSMMQGMSAMLERMTKQEAGQDEPAKKPKYEQLGGKLLEKVKKFNGGEEEGVEWSDDLRMYIDMQATKLAKVMKYVETHGEKSVDKAVKDLVEEDVEEHQQDYSDMDRLSKELFR